MADPGRDEEPYLSEDGCRITIDQEEKMIAAAGHVKAEKSQQQLFNMKIANAREDMK
jgi:hypothetical protein